MLEEAFKIFDYLPLRSNPAESEYMDHLWEAIKSLNSSTENARPFIMMPFHLLFMLAIQYKILRISKEINNDYLKIFTIERRGREALLSPKSVFEVALLEERTIPDIFKLISLDQNKISKIKALVDFRNDTLAHAKGAIEKDPERKIQEYIKALQELQLCLAALNDKIAKEWVDDLSEEDDMTEYIESKLLDSMMCPADFRKGDLLIYPYLSPQLMSEVEDMSVSPEERTQSNETLIGVFKKGLVVARSQTVPVLVELAHEELIVDLRYQNVKLLKESGLLDAPLKESLLKRETDPEIIKLIKE